MAEKNNYIYSQSSGTIFLIKYWNIICLICFFIITCTFFVTKQKISLDAIIFCYAILALIAIIPLPLFNKFIAKIEIDFFDDKIKLHLCRSDEIITSKFKDVKDIKINGYFIISINNKRYLFFETHDFAFLSTVNKIKKINWGNLCVLFGPDQSVRNNL